MKKTLAIVLCLCFVFALVGCNNTQIYYRTNDRSSDYDDYYYEDYDYSDYYYDDDYYYDYSDYYYDDYYYDDYEEDVEVEVIEEIVYEEVEGHESNDQYKLQYVLLVYTNNG